jgi:PHP family Zn ribbon phosphoesterase
MTFHMLEVEVGWCHTMNHLKANQEYFELYPLFNRKPMEIGEAFFTKTVQTQWHTLNRAATRWPSTNQG